MSAYPSDDFPEMAPAPSRFDDADKCTYCGHTREQHGPKNCGLLMAPNTCIFCRCPYNQDTP